MDLESFEPSDESMEKIEERLKELRELREVRMRPSFRSAFHHSFERKVPHDFSLKIDSADRVTDPFIFSDPAEEVSLTTVDTAYMRTLEHARLLKDLEHLGFREWESLGKKDEFDRITQQAIDLGRLEADASDFIYDDSEDDVSESDALSAHWKDDLEQLNRRARGVLLVNAQPDMKFTIADSKYCLSVFSGEESLHHNKWPSKIRGWWQPHFKKTPDLWVRRSAHEPLEYVIEVKGLHAEVAHDEDDVIVKYEGFEPDVRIGN